MKKAVIIIIALTTTVRTTILVRKISRGRRRAVRKISALEFTLLFHVFADHLQRKSWEKKIVHKSLDLLFSEAMLQEVILRTKEKIASVRNKYGENKPYMVKEIDVIGLKVLKGLLYYSGEFKAGHEGVRTLFPPKGARSAFRVKISMNRFLFPVSCLRLARTSDRNVRK